MKKIIIVSALLCSLLFAPVFVSAQATPTRDAVTQQLIQLLIKMIAQLQQQIDAILAQQKTQTTTAQQQTQTIQQIQQNTQQIAQNTTQTITPTPTQTNQPIIDIKANGSDGPITVVYGASPKITWTTKGMFGCSIANSGGGIMTGNHDNTSGTAPWSDGTTTVQCDIVQLANGDMVNRPTSDSVTINVDSSTIPAPIQVCTPNWQCGTWNMCSNSQQTRTCSDVYNCGVTTSKPALIQSCISPSYVPTVTINQITPTSGLLLHPMVNGDSIVGQVTVSAPASGDIKIARITFVCTGSGFVSIDNEGRAFGLQDEVPLYNGSTAIGFSQCDSGLCKLNNYVIPAGQSQTFNLKAGVFGSANAGATASVSCSLAPSGFIWKTGDRNFVDTSAGGYAVSNYFSEPGLSSVGNVGGFGGLFIPNFPTNSYTVQQ